MAQGIERRPKFDVESSARPHGPEDPADEHLTFNTVVGEGIRRARQEHGWTQCFLAEKARLSPNYIARLERGELGPSLFVANRICEALDIVLEALVVPASPGAVVSTRKAVKRRAVG